MKLLLCFACILGTAPLVAHEFWLQPSTFTPATGQALELTLRVGMDFKGEIRPFTRERVAAFHHLSSEGREYWIQHVHADPAHAPTSHRLRLEQPGTHVIAVDSTPSLITLDPEKFTAYLKDEGLDAVLHERALAGESGQPGRERYVRTVKTIVRAGGLADPAGYQPVGQRLELLPVAPSLEREGPGLFQVALVFERQPLPGALVRAWHRTGETLTTLETRSDKRGLASFTLPSGGEWMFSVVHMVRLKGVAEADWESIWGNLTVSLGPLTRTPVAVVSTPPISPGQASTGPATGPDSGESSLVTGPDGTVYLTWCAPGLQPGERALYLATLPAHANAWTPPRPVVSTPLLMENWADFASLAVGTDGTLWAQWFQHSAAVDAHGYDGWMARSRDGGLTWSDPSPLGHEFVSLAPLSGGRLLTVWLESARPPRAPGAPRPPKVERKPGEPTPPSMRLMSRLLHPNGSTAAEWIVDPDVCTCCQTTLTVLPGDRVFVAYRGRTPLEIRDHRRAIFDGTAWGPPATLHDDGWMIPACPVNGPAADTHGETLAVTWFTMANGIARVQAKQSRDGGLTFGPALPIDLGKPMGRLDLVSLPDQSSVLFWMEAKAEEGAAGIYARRLFPDGRISAAHLVADSSQARSSGFPRAAVRPNGRIVTSWTDSTEPTQVRVREWDPADLGDPAPLLSALPRAYSPAPDVCLTPARTTPH
jgi:uncharacterized GH25 family protein